MQGVIGKVDSKKSKQGNVFYIITVDGQELSTFEETASGLQVGQVIEYEKETKTVSGRTYNNLLSFKVVGGAKSPINKFPNKPVNSPPIVSNVVASVVSALIAKGEVTYQTVGPAILLVGEAAWEIATRPGDDSMSDEDIPF